MWAINLTDMGSSGGVRGVVDELSAALEVVDEGATLFVDARCSMGIFYDITYRLSAVLYISGKTVADETRAVEGIARVDVGAIRHFDVMISKIAPYILNV